MSEIMKELKNALKKQVFQKMWFKILVVFLVVIVGFGVYKSFVSPDVKKGEIGNKSVWNDYETLISEFDDTSKKLDGIEASDVSESSENDSSFDSRKVESVINEMFITANIANRDLFAATFTSEQLNKDFFKYDISERFTKMEEAMSALSRQGQLDRVEVVRGIPLINNNSIRVVLDVYYTDLIDPIRFSVIVQYLEQNQFNDSEGETMDFPYIDSSVWDMIEEIEG
ncbi:TPA: hypothetical protein NJY08_005058 [Salmonella enterica subsp. enterica serovar Typhi str. AG3]|nr:hypothetical protein [Salmonella enterica subsp. enterica serovar Typhi str. AG3]